MFTTRLFAAMLVPLAQAAAAAPRPVTLTEIDAGKLKGTPYQLAWSTDGSELYLQLAEKNSDGRIKKTHSFVIVFNDPSALNPVDSTPEWATAYWNWKSYKMPPNAEAPEIQVKQEQRARLATDAAMGGSINTGGGAIQGMDEPGTSTGAVAMRAQQQAHVTAVTLVLMGETIGEFVGVPAVPGYTFGWAPKAPMRIAYTTITGHLGVMDGQGVKREIPGTKNVSLPAWSPDDTKIAFVTQTGKNKYELCVVDARESS